MPRSEFTLKKKIAILDEIKTFPSKISHRKLAELTGVSKTTIVRLLQQEKVLRRTFESEQATGITSKFTRQRHGKNPVVEKALDKWFTRVSAQGVIVNGPILKQKAEEFAQKLGYNDFTATNGWLTRWKHRHHIVYKKAHDERDNTNCTSVDDWRGHKMHLILDEFGLDNVYNAQETGLYYRATPDGSLCYQNVVLTACKKTMDRFTILCCTNISGTDKKKLLVIGKCVKAHCLKELEIDNLQLQYIVNKNAWMTAEIFKNWLCEWDAELSLIQRKIVLIVEKNTAHPYVDDLKSIRVEYLLPNATSILQPLDVGIIKDLKIKYRKKLVDFILDALDCKIISQTTTANYISSKISLLDALVFISESWEAVSSATILNCSRACGLSDSDEFYEGSIIPEEDKDIINVGQAEYLDIDTNLTCYSDLVDIEDDIVTEIIEMNQKFKIEKECEPVLISDMEAKTAILTLKHYFMQEGKPDCSTAALNMYEALVDEQIIKDKK